MSRLCERTFNRDEATMTDRTDPLAPGTGDPTRPTIERDDSLREAAEPLKQHGDALRDGSGSRQGQSPPNVGSDPKTGA
jgi:hypothetical protein